MFWKQRVVALSPEEYLAKLLRKGLNEDGSPMLDPVPMAPPIGYRKQPSMVEIVRDMVRSERLRVAATEAGAETFEESEDFDVPDEFEAHSEYENDFDPPLAEITRVVEEERVSREAPPEEAPRADPPE